MRNLPPSLIAPVQEALRRRGDDTALVDAQPVGGGCINNGLRLSTEKSIYFLKWNSRPLPGMFPLEARGLQLIAETHTVRVPQVIGTGEPAPTIPAYILMEWLESSREGRRFDGMARLGEQLAAMHRIGVPQRNPLAFGLDSDNYIGSTPQSNGWEPDWVVFFCERRLRPQMELARANGHLPAHRQRRLEILMDRLPSLIGKHKVQPSLLHGDLWGGNVLPIAGGELALIDPAVYYGDREAELAFTHLFGGFSEAFYRAYQSVWPLEAGFTERIDLYNSYHLLNHLNLFGEGYGSQVDAILARYTGL
jgi:protein-ribulosamine 3-kinase